MNLAPLVEQYIWRTEIPLTRWLPAIDLDNCIGWNLGDCCSLGSSSPNSPNSHRKASRRLKLKGTHSHGFEAVGSALPCSHFKHSYSLKTWLDLVREWYKQYHEISFQLPNNLKRSIKLTVVQGHLRKEHLDPTCVEPCWHPLALHWRECQLQWAAHTKVSFTLKHHKQNMVHS